jgi:hypothetical protein
VGYRKNLSSMANVPPASTKGGPRDYKRILDNLMSSVHRLEVGQEYPYTREYTDDEREAADNTHRTGKMAKYANVWFN